MTADYLPDFGLGALSLGLRRPGRTAGPLPWHFSAPPCRLSPNKCVLLVWARLRAPGAEALQVPCTGTNARRPLPSPPAEGRVCVSVCVPACSQPPQALCPRRGCLSRLRDPRPHGGIPGRAWLQLRGIPDSANLPGARDRNPRAARSVQGFSASWAASPSAHGAARPPEPGDAWSAPAEAAQSPAARKASS